MVLPLEKYTEHAHGETNEDAASCVDRKDL